MKKTFPLRVVLTVTTGRLLTERKGPRDNGIGDLYELLNHMTQDNLFTHQLPRSCEECKPWLLRWFPELSVADDLICKLDEAAERSGGFSENLLREWLLVCEGAGLNREYDVDHIPQDDHERKDPYDELVEMRGTDEGVIIVDDPQDD